MSISAEEQQRRERRVRDARAGTEIEGGRTSEAVRAIQDQWVRGEITADQMKQQVRAQAHHEIAQLKTPTG